MNDYILLMHNDALAPQDDTAWGPYLASLRGGGAFEGGSAIGGGACFRKAGVAAAVGEHLTGYLRVQAESIDDARRFLAGNPVYEAGGTVEIRLLPRE